MSRYPNGRAPSPPLVSIYGCIAMPDMAQRVYGVKRDMKAETGVDVIVNEIYRTFPRQIEEKDRWTSLGFPNNAATPGYSKHGDDEVGAVDWACPDWAIPARRSIALRYGLHHDIANESWHATNWGDETHPLPTLEEALGNGAPTPITLEMLEDREMATVKEEILEALKRAGARGAAVVYWNRDTQRTYSVSPRCIKHHANTPEYQIALREGGQDDAELSMAVDSNELKLVFFNNGLSEFVDGEEDGLHGMRKINEAPPGFLFVPGAKL